MFKRVIGKTCKNPECQFKDQLKEASSVMCECGQALEDVTATDKTKIGILLIFLVLIIGGGGYLAYIQLLPRLIKPGPAIIKPPEITPPVIELRLRTNLGGPQKKKAHHYHQLMSKERCNLSLMVLI